MHPRMLFVALATLLLASCNRTSTKLDYTNAKGEVPQLGNLVFRFDKGLWPDSLTNNWDSTDFVSFEPEIRGKFRWEGPDQLIFSPAAPLSPATDYTAKIHDDVLKHSKLGKVEAEKLEFHTAPLALTDAHVTWVLQDEGSRTAVPQLALHFNYPVKPEELKEKLNVTIDGVKPTLNALTVSSSPSHALKLGGIKTDDRSYDAKVVLEKGANAEGGNTATKETIETEINIPSPYTLVVYDIKSEHDGSEGVVHISASQQLDAASLHSNVSFQPAVPFRVQITEFGATLYSDKFDMETPYSVVLKQGLRGKIGGVLKEDFNGSVGFGELEAGVKFTNSKAVFLSKRGGGNIEVRITNTPKVKLIISRIYESNLLAAQRTGYEPKDDKENGGDGEYYDDGYYEGYSGYDDFSAGDVVYTKEIDTRSLPKSAGGRVLNVSQFEDRLPDAKGIYHVKLQSTEDYWISDSRFISLSDLGLIAKGGSESMTVFVNSIKGATAVEGVTVNVYGKNNQLLGTAASNGDGVAEVKLATAKVPGNKPVMIIAKTAEDFTYLPFYNTKVNTSRFDVGGKTSNATGLDAFVYAERDIYRPGEKINFAIAVRDRQWKSPGELPLKLKLIQPNGKEFKTFRKSLNDGGATEGSIDIPGSAITGTYALEVYSSNDILLTTQNFMIEEFVPDRIKVTPTLNRKSYAPGETIDLALSAVNFFGPPAANRNYEAELQLSAKSLKPKGMDEYDFSLSNGETYFEKILRQGTTNEAGGAAENFRIPETYRGNGLLQAKIYTTVFDETGRPVSRVATADVPTQPMFFGVKDDGYYYYALNQPVKFNLAAVNAAGAPAGGQALVQVIKREYKTVLAKSGSYFRYESQQTDKKLVEGTIQVGNGTVYQYIPRSPGDYELRISMPGSNAYVRKTFYSYGYGGGDNNSFEVNTEGQIDISVDKESYSSGDGAKVLFKTPFNGRMLVTLERDGLISHQYIDVQKRSAAIEIKLEGVHVPNVYVTATLFKPHGISDIPLTVAHGFQNISVAEKSRQIPVSIEAQATSRSRKTQTVRVKAAPNSWVTLAAVDNGVLQVSDFKTPDPYNYFYQKRALETTAWDMYPLLFPELRLRNSSTGGDGEGSMDKRVNPMPAKRIKILSYWSGLKKTGGGGDAEFQVEIPQFSGQVRLMAVAIKDDRFGSSEATMTVADPIVLSTALPRFLSPGDTATIPVNITNTTGKPASGTATLSVTGPLQVVGGNTQTINLQPNTEGKATFQVVAANRVDVGKVSVSVNALGEKFGEDIEISVRPPSTLQMRTGSGSIAAGQSAKVPFPTGDFLAGTTDYELVVTRSPVGELADQLRWLVQYPYGCTEQTISSAFPQLYFADLSNSVQRDGHRAQAATQNVNEAIRRIKMRQLYSGAVTLWDGEGAEDWWTTTYAAHFLLEAKKAGYDVDPSLLETMLGYLTNRLRNRQTITYYYNRDQNRQIAPKEVPYSLYVLAISNRQQVSAMNFYKASPTLLALDGRYLLSAAYAVAGDKRSFASLLPRAFSGEESVQQTGGSFYSATRDEAIALNALIETDPGNAQIPVMAAHVQQRLKTERYLNTQERAWSFLALGKLARASNAGDAEAEIRVDGKRIAGVDDDAQDWRGDKANLGSGNVEIVAKGKGRIYYSWQAKGISRTGDYVEEDAFIKVRRQYYSRNGVPISNLNFKQNELIIVGVKLEKAYSSSIQNIVITDLLPAGFEIENPRTKELPGMDWIKNASEPLSLDVRDDRIHFFVDANSNAQTYYYAVRAVSTGQFVQGPVSADAMYNGEIHSYHGRAVVRVVR